MNKIDINDQSTWPKNGSNVLFKMKGYPYLLDGKFHIDKNCDNEILSATFEHIRYYSPLSNGLDFDHMFTFSVYHYSIKWKYTDEIYGNCE